MLSPEMVDLELEEMFCVSNLHRIAVLHVGSSEIKSMVLTTDGETMFLSVPRVF